MGTSRSEADDSGTNDLMGRTLRIRSTRSYHRVIGSHCRPVHTSGALLDHQRWSAHQCLRRAAAQCVAHRPCPYSEHRKNMEVERTMAIELSAIRPGQCYVTKHAEVRKVLSIKDGIVTYDSRGPRPGSWTTRPTVRLEIFARDAIGEGECDQKANTAP